jgi:hypothetical protein
MQVLIPPALSLALSLSFQILEEILGEIRLREEALAYQLKHNQALAPGYGDTDAYHYQRALPSSAIPNGAINHVSHTQHGRMRQPQDSHASLEQAGAVRHSQAHALGQDAGSRRRRIGQHESLESLELLRQAYQRSHLEEMLR